MSAFQLCFLNFNAEKKIFSSWLLKYSFVAYRLLEMATDPGSTINDRDRVALIQYVAGNFIGVDLTFHYIRNNLNSIVRK